MKSLLAGSVLLMIFYCVEFANAQTVMQSWVRRFDGPASGDEQANAIAVDGAGNIYVTGSALVVENSND